MSNQAADRYGPTLVLMAGLPGAGKTTLAYRLSRELGWQVVDKDRHRESLLKQGWDVESAATAAYECSFDEIRTALVKEQASVIFDTAALHHFILDTVNEIICKAENARLKVLLCVADRDLRNHRLHNKRELHTNIRVDPSTIDDYLEYFKHLPSDKLILNTCSPLETCLILAKNYVLN